MKKSLALIVLFLSSVFAVSAQYVVPEGYQLVDSVIFIADSPVDTTITGDIFTMMPSTVKVTQSVGISDIMSRQILKNSQKTVKGYRIRIYFDNKQDSRTASEQAMKKFLQAFPGVQAYRSFSSPFFKVTVGDYRTKAEALAALDAIKAEFPAAFIVKDKFRYPNIGFEYGYRIDTIKVLRPLGVEL